MCIRDRPEAQTPPAEASDSVAVQAKLRECEGLLALVNYWATQKSYWDDLECVAVKDEMKAKFAADTVKTIEGFTHLKDFEDYWNEMPPIYKRIPEILEAVKSHAEKLRGEQAQLEKENPFK